MIKGIDVPGYHGKYTVFEDGSVQSLHNRNIIFLKPKRAVYLRVALYGEHGRKEFLLHRLVATCFIPNPLNLPYVNHKDGNRYNNDVSNLEWCTPSENLLHSIHVLKRVRNTQKQRESAISTGKARRKLTLEQAAEIRVKSQNTSRRALSIEYGVSLSTIDRIVLNLKYMD